MFSVNQMLNFFLGGEKDIYIFIIDSIEIIFLSDIRQTSCNLPPQNQDSPCSLGDNRNRNSAT